MMDIIAVLRNAQAPNYVAPITLDELGALSYHRGVAFSEKWPTKMQASWLRESRRAADAQTSAYLVSVGVAQ